MDKSPSHSFQLKIINLSLSPFPRRVDLECSRLFCFEDLPWPVPNTGTKWHWESVSLLKRARFRVPFCCFSRSLAGPFLPLLPPAPQLPDLNLLLEAVLVPACSGQRSGLVCRLRVCVRGRGQAGRVLRHRRESTGPWGPVVGRYLLPDASVSIRFS